MADTPTAEPRKAFWWLAGRAGRAEYWASIVLLLAFGYALSFTPLATASNSLWIVCMFIEIRRVHDFGRTGWWAVAANAVPAAVMLAWMTIASLDVALMVAVCVQLVLMIWIGVIRGDREENRFGPPAPFSWRRTITGR